MNVTDRDYIAIHAWMWSHYGLGLKLGSIELCLYARIYGYSRKGAGIYFETQEAAARAFEVSVRQIQRCVKSLCESGLIIEVGRYRLGNSRDARRWRVSQEAIDSAIVSYDKMIASLSGDRMSHGAPSDILSGGGATLCRTAPCDNLSGGPNDHRTESRTEFNDGFRGSKVLRTSESSTRPSIQASQDKYEQLDGEARIACIALMVRSINQRATSEEVAAAYTQALEKGYTPDQIACAYDRYIARYRRDNPDTARYAMRLDKYLTRGDGLRFDMPKPANRRKASSATHAGSAVEQSREAFTDALCHQYPEYDDMVRSRSAMYAQQGKAMLLKDEETANSYVEKISEISRLIEAFEADHVDSTNKQPKGADFDG